MAIYQNFKLNERNEGTHVYISNLHTCLKLSVRWIMTEDSSLCNSTPMNLLSARDRLRLERDCSASAEENRKEGDESGLM